MAERVRRFRVVKNNGCESCGVKVGDVSEFVREHKWALGKMIFLKALPHWTRYNDPDGTHEIRADYLEELPTFVVGDAVRVKAGVKATYRGQEHECTAGIGRKLEIGYMGAEGNQCDVKTVGKYESVPSIDVCCLEPWNDAEEWDGSKWVAKKPKVVGTCKPGIHLGVDLPSDLWANGRDVESVNVNGAVFIRNPAESSGPKPAIVCLREDGELKAYTATAYDSTNEAFKKAEQFASQCPGKEYVVLQEKGSKRVERKPSAAEVVALAVSGEIDDKYMSKWEFRDGTSVGVVPMHMEWTHGSDEVTIRVRCHHKA